MDITWFRDLNHVEKTGNFSQAAVLSNLSQPALSRRIQALELWVGCELVDRSRQPVELTSAGSQMLEAGQQAVERIERERSQILEAQSLPDKYVVTFSTQHSIGWRFFPSWLQSFEDTYGPILTRLRADDLPNCLRDLSRGDADFVIAYASETQPKRQEDKVFDTFEAIAIGTDKLVPVCRRQADGSPLFNLNSEGAKVPFLRFGDSAPISRHLAPLLRHAGLAERLQTVYENSMAGALRIRARDGAGVTWLPYSLVRPDLESGVLIEAGQKEWEVKLEIKLLRKADFSNHLTRSIWSFLNQSEGGRVNKV